MNNQTHNSNFIFYVIEKNGMKKTSKTYFFQLTVTSKRDTVSHRSRHRPFPEVLYALVLKYKLDLKIALGDIQL